jgi:hypothetical protein
VAVVALVHPFERWATADQVVLLAVAGVTVLVGIAVMGRLGRTMRSSGGAGIVAFELAGSVPRARMIQAGWSGNEKKPMKAAAWSLVVDVPFLAAYGIGLAMLASLAAESARRHGWGGAADVAALAAWAALVAAAFDLIEDAALGLVLAKGWSEPSNVEQPGPRIAQVAATLKFSLLAFAAWYLVTLAVVGGTALLIAVAI